MLCKCTVSIMQICIYIYANMQLVCIYDFIICLLSHIFAYYCNSIESKNMTVCSIDYTYLVYAYISISYMEIVSYLTPNRTEKLAYKSITFFFFFKKKKKLYIVLVMSATVKKTE